MSAKSDTLGGFVAGIQSSLDAGESPCKIIDALVRDHGARLQFKGGGNELRLDGVVATCTTTDRGLLCGWMRAAERRIASELAKELSK